jgi:hypothetical protein
MKPQHSICRVCCRRIARLTDRERWHHYGGQPSGHMIEPMDPDHAAIVIEALNRIGGQEAGRG